MKIIKSSQYDLIKSEILSRGDLDYKDINITVEKIVEDVKQDGDSAILKYTKKFDGADLETMEVTKERDRQSLAKNSSIFKRCSYKSR